MGIETKNAIISDRSYELNFTNEGGIEGTTRFLKNICGMWLYERCRKEWPEEVRQLSHPELQGSAMQVEAFRSVINPDDKVFANPPSMIEAIQQYCQQTGQPVPETPAEICRCIFDSLALRYRQVFGWLKELRNPTGKPSDTIQVLHVIGGGSLNKYLTQFTADALGIEVLAGPQECTAIGNIMLQAKAMGVVRDIWQMRGIIANSVEMVAYHPTADKAAWDAAYEKYLTITNQK
jgi:rhamnulokinase